MKNLEILSETQFIYLLVIYDDDYVTEEKQPLSFNTSKTSNSRKVRKLKPPTFPFPQTVPSAARQHPLPPCPFSFYVTLIDSSFSLLFLSVSLSHTNI